VITRAYLVAGRDAPADRVIGGLSILLRQILSLQNAGISEIVLVGVSRPSPDADPRVHAQIREAAESAALTVDRPAIVAPVGAVWHRAVAQRLVRAGVGEHDAIRAGSAGAALYAAGAARVAPIVSAMIAGSAGSCSASDMPLRDPEFVVVVRSAAGAAAATGALMRALDKPTDGIISRRLHRRLSLPISGRLLHRAVTPNHLTAIAALFGAAAVWVASRGSYLYLLAGSSLFEVQSILDGCDGEIARMKHLQSRAGEWFDQVADDALNIAFLVAVGVALTHDGSRYAWRLAVVSLLSQAIYVVALYAGLALKAGGRGSVATLRWWVDAPPDAVHGRAWRQTATRIAGDLTRRDFIGFCYFICAAAGRIEIAFVWHAAVTIVSAAVTAIGWIAFGGPDARVDAGALAESTGSHGVQPQSN
jgi:1L-myo-inositol 1-phosphate cytidylyltransferase / CDP-L-myo-inositol myo-inositolphosphotransferase